MSLSDFQQAMMDDLDEIRLLVLDHIVAKKKKVEFTYNKKVWPKSFKERDLVWKLILPIGHKDRQLRKWSPNWKVSYPIKKILPRGAYHLAYQDGKLHE